MRSARDAALAGPGEPPSFCLVMPYHILEGRGGGAEVQAWFLARELARRGYRTSYVAQSVQGKQDTIDNIEGVSVHWVRFANRFRWSNSLAYFRALSRVNADIVVQRMTSFTTGVLGLWCRFHRRKFVWICTDNTVPRKWAFLHIQRTANRTGSVGRFKGALFLLDALFTDLARNRGMKHVWLAFTQNDDQKKLLEEQHHLTSRRMISGHAIPDKTTSVRDRLNRPMVVWAANMGAKKRPEKFIELARLADKSALQFVMIGGHSNAARMTELFSDPPPNLKWLGHVSFDESLALIDQAVFFANTSVQEHEGFPNTFIQAWLRGVPVVSLEVDPDDIVRKHKLGCVNSDPKALLAYMHSMISHPQAYQQLAGDVRAYAQENHSIAMMCDRFLIDIQRNGESSNSISLLTQPKVDG